MVFLQDQLNRVKAGEPTRWIGQFQRTAVTIWRFSFDRGKEQWFEPMMKEFDIADTDRTDGVAMVGEFQMEKAVFGSCLRMRLLPVLHGHLERNFDRGRAVVGVKHS